MRDRVLSTTKMATICCYMRVVLIFVVICCCVVVRGRTIPGISVLDQRHWDDLRGFNVAVLTNPSAVLPKSLEHIVDVLHAKKINVVAVLAPEHGFRGDRQAETGDDDEYTDSYTNFSVFSVYRKSGNDIKKILTATRTSLILVDMQDVGVRLYTFVWTMFDVIAASDGLQVLVLDRPNPLGGEIVEGPALNATCCASRYGRMSGITHRHGMTIGELALMFANETRSNASTVSVVKMVGWNRSFGWEETAIPFVPPSPNLPTPLSVKNYLDTVWLEATTISEGRGTNEPFSVFGAPWFRERNNGSNAVRLASQLNANDLTCPTIDHAEACFRADFFIPTFFKYNNTVVGGVQWTSRASTDERIHSMIARTATFPRAAQILLILMRLSGSNLFQFDGSWFGESGSRLFDLYAGSPVLRGTLETFWRRPNATGGDIAKIFERDAATFREKRMPFLLYL
eukprot:g4395.t1